ncbi:MAG: 50S ribosomal protein L23 [Patescibacteria group bacterium]|nr:50S ribosomal protein L23 [Patescibacteria group bacterium]
MSLKPVISEKSMSNTASGKYIFKVSRNANKIEIANSIEKVYKVNVVSINTVNMRAKQRRFRFCWHFDSAQWKKAIITLKKGQKIEGFEIKEEKKNKEKKGK